jgi:hypothetical protein
VPREHGLFALFVVGKIPFPAFPAVILGLLLFAPVFGTIVVGMERAAGAGSRSSAHF